MTNYQKTIQQRTEDFAIRVVKAYVEINQRHFDDAGKVLSKQFLRSGTSIGANCAEAFAYGESPAKLSARSSALLNQEMIIFLNILLH